MSPYLMDLPLELREEVYRYVGLSQPPVILIHRASLQLEQTSPEPLEHAYPSLGGTEEDNGQSSSNERTKVQGHGRIAQRDSKRRHHLGRRLVALDDEEEQLDQAFAPLLARFTELESTEHDDDDVACSAGLQRLLLRPGKLILRYQLNTSLLLTNRQVHNEAALIFYENLRFVLDVRSVASMLFLRSLPRRILHSITNLTIRDHALTTPRIYRRGACDMSATTDPFQDTAMFRTPFGFLIDVAMLNLQHVYLGVLWTSDGVDVDHHCVQAVDDLAGLLARGRIETLSLVLKGKFMAEIMRLWKTDSCDALLPQRLLHLDRKVARRTFESLNHHYRGTYPNPSQWVAAREAFVNKQGARFDKQLGQRNINIGAGVTVQAVVELRLSRSPTA